MLPALAVSSEASIRSSPTTATRSPPETPPKVRLLATSELAKAIAITSRNASVMPTPSFDLKKLRKNWSMKGLSRRLQGAPDPVFAGAGAFEGALYPACGVAATVDGPIARPGQLRF